MSSHRIDMKNLITGRQSNKQNDQAIKRNPIPQSEASFVELEQKGALKLVAQWQERGPETLSGHGVRTRRSCQQSVNEITIYYYANT